jgi:hypothetical protein
MKRTFMRVAMVLLMSSGVANAENWKTIGLDSTGAIFEIDLDTIQHNSYGSTTVKVGANGENVTWFFDCQSHYGWSAKNVIHIPKQSIAEAVESVVCQPEIGMPPKPDKSKGCTNQKLDDRVPLCGG